MLGEIGNLIVVRTGVIGKRKRKERVYGKKPTKEW